MDATPKVSWGWDVDVVDVVVADAGRVDGVEKMDVVDAGVVNADPVCPNAVVEGLALVLVPIENTDVF